MKKKKESLKSQSKTVSFRLNALEKQSIKELADKQGISEAKFIENIVKPHIKEYASNLKMTKNKRFNAVSLEDISLDDEVNTNDLKLKIQLIPYKTRGNNLRKIRSKAAWKELREEQLKKDKYRCTICGDSNRELHCHEDWLIDHESLTQHLQALKTVCEYCHHCIHWNFMQSIDIDGKLTEKMTDHFLKVNNCGNQTLLKNYTEEMKLFNKNIKNNYRLSLGEFDLHEENFQIL